MPGFIAVADKKLTHIKATVVTLHRLIRVCIFVDSSPIKLSTIFIIPHLIQLSYNLNNFRVFNFSLHLFLGLIFVWRSMLNCFLVESFA